MKKDLSNRLPLTAYESESAFELTGHFYCPVAVSLMWHLAGQKNFRVGWSHGCAREMFLGVSGNGRTKPQHGHICSSVLLFPPGDSTRKTLTPLQEERANEKGLPPNESFPPSLNHCLRIVRITVYGSVSSSLPEKKAWFSKLWIGHPDLGISLRTLRIYRTISVLYVIVQEVGLQTEGGKRGKQPFCELQEKEKITLVKN